MNGINHVLLLGVVYSTPVIKMSKSNSMIMGFALITASEWRDRNSGEVRRNEERHQIQCFGRLAEQWEHRIREGDVLRISGSIRSSKSNSGQVFFSIQANEIESMSDAGSFTSVIGMPKGMPFFEQSASQGEPDSW